MNIKYISYFDTEDNINENRSYVLAATNKMKYIVSVLEKNNFNVEIVSVSSTKNKKFYKGKKVNISQNTVLKLFPTFPWGNKIQKFISIYSMRIFLFIYLFFNTKKNDILIIYHSMGYMFLLELLKKIKKIKYVIEAEEIYSDVFENEKIKLKEMNFFNIADGYILPTELLNESINTKNKPCTIVYGTYAVEKNRNIKFNDNKIHIVYAGTFDPRKGGANAAVSAAEYLNEKYHMHIIGFGNEKDKKKLLDEMENVAKKTKCKVTYDGLLSGEDYIKFIQSCDIGLSTQKPIGKYNETSFPSKVLSYLANGLRVVSIRIKVLEIASINNILYYYNEDTPMALAEAIKKVDTTQEYDSRELISKLNDEFSGNLQKMLSDIVL